MEFIEAREHLLRIIPGQSAITYTTDRVSQLPKGKRRGKSYKAIYVKNPYLVVSINPFTQGGIRNLDILRKILCKSSITTFDTYSFSDDLTGVNCQIDPFNVDALLFANKGRLAYDLSKYATSEVTLDFVSTAVFSYMLKVRVEYYSC